MKKKGLGIILLITLLMSCTTVQPTCLGQTAQTTQATGLSEIIIVNNAHVALTIEINGQSIGNIQSRASKMFQISNGPHIVSSRSFFSDVRSGSMSLDINNERIEMEANIVSRPEGGGHTISFEMIRRIAFFRPEQEIPLRGTAITNTFNTLNPLIPDGSRIAIVNITPSNSNTEFIQEELMVLFVNSRKFSILDRQALDSIREEQRFQMTGEVSDQTAVSIGQFLGADVVIVGSITGNVPQRRLRMRAINVQTAQILAMSSEEI